jgi:hypothetical protein
MHELYNGLGMAICGVALLMILVAFLKGKGKKGKLDV